MNFTPAYRITDIIEFLVEHLDNESELHINGKTLLITESLADHFTEQAQSLIDFIETSQINTPRPSHYPQYTCQPSDEDWEAYQQYLIDNLQN